MALPPRIPRKPKRSTRWRSQAHLAFVRAHHCSMEGCCGAPIEAAHVRIGSEAGMSQKPDDFRAVSLCKYHHQLQHEVGELTFWAEYEASGQGTVEELIEAFCAASPKAREIAAIRKERDAA